MSLGLQHLKVKKADALCQMRPPLYENEFAANAMVRRLAEKAKVEQPNFWVKDVSHITASAEAYYERGNKVTCVSLSRGAIEKLSPQELEGVAAHEISHINNGDVNGRNYIAGLSSAWLKMTLGLVAVWVAVRMHFARRSEYKADRGAVMLTGNANAYVSALGKISSDNGEGGRKESLLGLIFSDHPPTAKRIARLQRAGPG